MQELSDETAAQVMAQLPNERRRAIERLLTHPEDTAGGRMTGQLVTVRPQSFRSAISTGYAPADRPSK